MKKLLLTLTTLSIGGLLFASVPKSEKQALLDLYQQTKGATWNQTWNLSEDVALWEGVTIFNGHVTEIRMLFNNLEGTLPVSLGDLRELKVLELSFNRITGSLPASLGSLKQLEVLALNGNFIKGSIPDSFGNLENLKQLHLSSNQLSGTLPNSLNRLHQLEVFNVFQNKLHGEIPIAISRNRNIKEFVIAENNFKPSPEVSKILLGNSAQIGIQGNGIRPESKQIIALETEEGN